MDDQIPKSEIWWAGVLSSLLFLFFLALAIWLGWMLLNPFAGGNPRPFPVEPVASNHAKIAGQLAAFAIAILLIFLGMRINQRGAILAQGGDPSKTRLPVPEGIEQSVVIILVLAFFALLATAILYSIAAGEELPSALVLKGLNAADSLTAVEKAKILRMVALVTLPALTYFYGVVLLILVLKPVLIMAGQIRARWLVSWIATLTLLVGYAFIWGTLSTANVHQFIPPVALGLGIVAMWSLDLWAQIRETVEHRLIGYAAKAGVIATAGAAALFVLTQSQLPGTEFWGSEGLVPTIILIVPFVFSLFTLLRYIHWRAPERERARRSHIEFLPIGSLTIKGLPEEET